MRLPWPLRCGSFFFENDYLCNMISKYILDYLLAYQRVEVAGFGVFILVNTSAKMNEDNNLLPPAKKVSFEFDETTEDNGLAKFISQNSDCDTDSALKYIKQNTEEWLVKVKNHLPLRLDQIGTFTHFEDKLNFSGERIESAIPDFFGLEKINIEAKYHEKNKENNFWNRMILWLFLMIIPLVGLLIVGLWKKDFILDKIQHGIQQGTERIED